MINNPAAKADSFFNASQKRDAAKDMAARQRAALDAKLAKLRALRLAKEEADKEAAKLKSTRATAQKKRARPKSP
jgi:hypothetical protein